MAEQVLPVNHESRIPVRVGAIAGVAGSFAVVVVITGMLIAVGEPLFTAPLMIASTVFGATEGALPIVLGTIIHFGVGAALGAAFAAVMPCTPRQVWLLGGVLYGVLVGIIASVVLLALISMSVNLGALILGHVVYGMVLGTVGAFYQI